MYPKNKHSLAWLTLAGAVFAAACGVDLNEEPYAPPGGGTQECEAAMRSRIRILQTAPTTELEPPSKQPVPKTVALLRPDPADAAKLVSIASLGFNGTTSVTLCPGTVDVTLRSQEVKDSAVAPVDLTVAQDVVIAPMKNYTWVVAGNITPGAGEDPVRLLTVDETMIPMGSGDVSNIVIVNALRDSPTIAIDTDRRDTAVGPEVLALDRYATSALVPVAPAKDTPTEVKIEVLDGATSKASFTIEAFPKGKNLVVVLYDELAIDEDTEKTQARLFLTGSGDPLVGNAPGNGIKFTAD